jgi:hypothetical protein
MPRIVLTLLVLALLALVLVDKGADFMRSREPEPEIAERTAQLAVAPLAPPHSSAAAPRLEAPGSALDQLARLAVRKAIRGEGDRVYFDSLLTTTDSVVRHWPNGSSGSLLSVAIVTGGPPGFRPPMAGYVRDAFDEWDLRRLGLRWEETTDTGGAVITVHWINRFPIDRAGQTDLTWDRWGRIRRAEIVLAVNDTAGTALPIQALKAVALHEVGHALGLPHSADSGDIMYSGAMAPHPSSRDVRTLGLLYELPVGSVKDSSDRPRGAGAESVRP